MMEKLKCLAAVLLIAMLASCAATKTEQGYKVEKVGDNVLWHVESDFTEVYILGSVHIGDESFYPLSDEIMNAFEQSDYLVVEVDMESVDPMKSMELFMYSDGQTLKKNVSKETYAMLIKKFKEFNIPEMMYSRMKPWAAALTVTMMAHENSGISQAGGIEQHFINKKGDRKVLELESLEIQAKYLSEFDKLSNDYIQYSLQNVSEEIDKTRDLIESWKKGEIEAVDKYIEGEIGKFPELKSMMEKLVNERNVNMVKKIDGYLESSGTYFVVVGAGHLPGENGIINLLRKTKDWSEKEGN